MKVYCAFQGEYSYRALVGVYTTKAEAEKHAASWTYGVTPGVRGLLPVGHTEYDVEDVDLAGAEVAELDRWLAARG